MRTSEQTNEISAALAKAQGEMKNPEKNKTATIPTKAGGKYTFNYADLPGTYDTNRAVLAANGLAHTFATVSEEGGTRCVCRLTHSSGQWYESDLGLPESGDIKTLAANLTYLRRYLYSGLVGVAGEEDVDGEPEHSEAKYQSRAPQPKSKTAKEMMGAHAARVANPPVVKDPLAPGGDAFFVPTFGPYKGQDIMNVDHVALQKHLADEIIPKLGTKISPELQEYMDAINAVLKTKAAANG